MAEVVTFGATMSGRDWLRRHPIGSLVAKRLLGGAVVVWVVVTLTFAALALIPGDPARTIAGPHASPAAIRQIRQELHLNRPVLTRYVDWLSGAVHGNLGRSLTEGDHIAVWQLISDRLRNSAILATLAAIVLGLVATAMGIFAGTRAGSASDHATSLVALAMMALPEFVIGTLLAYVFGIMFHLLPPVALFSPAAGPFSRPTTLILPVATLVIVAVGFVARMVRASVAQAMSADYVRMARLNGISEPVVILRYALRNALAPSIQAFSLTLLYLVGGVVIVEAVFQYPGIGLLALDATDAHDYPTVLGVTAVIAVIYVIINLVNDLVIVLLTPKLRVPT